MMNTVPRSTEELPVLPIPEPRFKTGDMLAHGDEFYGTIVLIEGTYPYRFYGVRMRDFVGICMINSKLLDDPEAYPGISRIN